MLHFCHSLRDPQEQMQIHVTLDFLGRIACGIVGGTTLSIALFMYPPEKERWQSRLEQVWEEIYEHAQHTDTVFTALVNKISTGTNSVLNRIFGSKRYSWKMITVSVISSYMLSSLASPLEWFFAGSLSLYFRAFVSIHDWLPLLVCPILLYFSIRFDRKSVQIICLSLVMADFIYDNLPAILGFGDLGYRSYSLVVQTLVFVVSWVIDAFALVLIRARFHKLKDASTISQTLVGSVILLAIPYFTCILPLQFVAVMNQPDGPVFPMLSVTTFMYFMDFCGFLGSFNVNTTLYCLIPSLVLLGLVLHKILWPLLARLIFPLKDFKIVQDRKLLISIGILTLGYAIGGDHLVLKILEKLA